jgi:hypothetical protein
MATGTNPFTGYLPLLFSYNIIYFNNGLLPVLDAHIPYTPSGDLQSLLGDVS